MKRALIALGVLVAASDSAADPGIAAPNSEPEGQSYSQWAADWWRWALAHPSPVNPLTDRTGEHCAVGQKGSVWFLAGNFGGTTRRACTVPFGRALFFPILSRNHVQTYQDGNYSIRALREANRKGVEGAKLSATIDGRPVADLAQYYQESAIYIALLPADNILGYDDAQCAPDELGRLACLPALDAGYYLFVKPFSRGMHTIHFTAAAAGAPFSLDVTYKLRVE